MRRSAFAAIIPAAVLMSVPGGCGTDEPRCDEVCLEATAMFGEEDALEEGHDFCSQSYLNYCEEHMSQLCRECFGFSLRASVELCLRRDCTGDPDFSCTDYCGRCQSCDQEDPDFLDSSCLGDGTTDVGFVYDSCLSACERNPDAYADVLPTGWRDLDCFEFDLFQ